MNIHITTDRIKKIAYFLPILSLIYVYEFGVNVIFWDEVQFVDMFNDNVDFWKFILHPHNEHFMPFGKLEYYVLAKITSMNSKVVMYADIFILWITYLFLIKKIETKNVLFAITSVIVFYLALFSPLSWQNLLWGFQVSYLTAFSFAILPILLCDSFIRTKEIKYLLIASCCCFIASLNSSHGILSWISIFSVTIYSKQYKKCSIALYPCLFIVTFYLIERSGVTFQTKQGTDDLSLFSIAQFFLTFVSSNIWSFKFEYGWIVGVVIVVAMCYLIIYKKLYKNYLVTTLFALGLLIAAMVTFGRWRLGLPTAYSSRYFQLQMPVYLAFAVVMSQYRYIENNEGSRILLVNKNNTVLLRYSPEAFIGLIVVVVFEIIFLTVSISDIPTSASRHKELVRESITVLSYEDQPQSVIKSTVYPGYKRAINQLEILKSKKLNVFSSIPNLPFNQVSFSNIESYQPVSDAKFNVENFKLALRENYLYVDIKGWCFDEAPLPNDTTWKLLLESSNKFYEIPLNTVVRPDVSQVYNSKLDNSGFSRNDVYLFKRENEIKYPVKLYLVNETSKVKKLIDIKLTVTSNN